MKRQILLAAFAVANLFGGALPDLRNFPTVFEENRGQFRVGVAYGARLSGTQLGISPDGLRLEANANGRSACVLITWKNARLQSRQIIGENERSTKANYVFGSDRRRWLLGVRTFGRIRVAGIRPGIDLVVYTEADHFEYDLVLKPHVEPSSLSFQLEGAEHARISREGDLILDCQGLVFHQKKPRVFQEYNGHKREVASNYILEGKSRVSFQFAAYDRSRSLIVDPALSFTSVFGGSGSDIPKDIAVDATGNIYVVGDTSSVDFPLQQPYQLAPSSGQGSSRHIFVTKLDPTASHILFSTYLGGSAGETARRIAVNSAGEVFVTGSTVSPDYPVTTGAFNYSACSLDNVVISKLSSSGTLLTSAVLGGTNDDEVAGLAVDAAGAIYLSGTTNSPNFPVTAGTRNDLSKLDTQFSGAKVFVTKLNSSMNALVYSSVIGGTGVDQASGMVIDGSGCAYVAGTTTSRDFPVTASAYQLSASGTTSKKGFVAKLSATGGSLQTSTYLGGSGDDVLSGIALDSSNNIYVSGTTTSSDFPLTSNAYFAPLNGGVNSVFVTKLKADSSGLLFSSLFGGNENRVGDLAVTVDGEAIVAGSIDRQFPITTGAPQVIAGNTASSQENAQGTNAFLLKLNASGTTPVFASYLGGLNATGTALATGTYGSIYIAGTGDSTFPATPGAFTATGKQVFVTRIVDPSNCTYSIQASSPLLVNVITQSGCGWMAVSGASWLHVLSGAAGSGNGSFQLSADPNQWAARTGQVSIAGNVYSISQTSACQPDLLVSSRTFASTGGSDQFDVILSPGCSAPAASTSVPWIHITSASGAATVSYSVDPNLFSTSRSGVIQVGPRSVTVSQSTAPCAFSVFPSIVSVGQYSATSVLITANYSTCSWTAASNSPWVSFTPSSGSGSSSVTVTSTAPQSDPPRSTTATIAAHTIQINIVGTGTRQDPDISARDFGTAVVGQNPSVPAQLTFSFPAGSTPAAATLKYGIDFSAGTLTCSGTTIVTCSTTVAFNPRSAGERRDAVLITDRAGSALSLCFIHGLGVGPQLVFRGALSRMSVSATPFASHLVALDPSDNLYVADNAAHVVRKVDPHGAKVTTIAGTGIVGYSGDGSLAVNATVGSISGIAIDAAGNLFISDGTYNTVRRISAVTGIITTVAGQTPAGYSGDGGPALAARLNRPGGLAVDGSGNLYIADTLNQAIRRIDAITGIITTVAGIPGSTGYSGDGGSAQSARLNGPQGVALSAAGDLYIADTANQVIRKVNSATNIMTTVAGTHIQGFSGDGGQATAARLNRPTAIAFDPAGNLYIADQGNSAIRVISADTQVISTIAGQIVSGSISSVGLNAPASLVFDSSGTLYIGDNSTDGMRELPASPQSLSFASTKIGQSSVPQGVTIANSGNAPFVVSSIGMTGANATDFVQTNNCGSTLAVNGTCSISAVFIPASFGPRSANLRILTQGGSMQLVPMSGVGLGMTHLWIDQPGAINSTFAGLTWFYGWGLDDNSPMTSLAVSIDGAPYGNATYGLNRPDVCAVYLNRPGCPNVGWSFSIDTAALVNGTHAFQITSTTAAGRHATLSASFSVANWTTYNPMQVSIDLPRPLHSTLFGLASFAGWAIEDHYPVTSVGISIDGFPYGNAVYGGSRPDVCAAYPNRPGCPNVGWSFPIDTTALANGPHTLQVTGNTSNGRHSTITTFFDVANAPSRNTLVYIDRPNAQTPLLSNTASFSGWAIDSNSAIASVSTSIDGALWGTATYGGNRPDVCMVYPNRPGCPNVGWNFSIDTTLLANGVHMLQTTAVSASGRRGTDVRSFTVKNQVIPGITRLLVDQPSAFNSTFTGLSWFYGWGIDDNSPITSLAVSIDGIPYGNASYGLSRPDVCMVYPSRPGCPHVGWSFSIDTTVLANGSHTFQITSTSAAGRHATLSASFSVANWTTYNPMQISIDLPRPLHSTLFGLASFAGWAIEDHYPVTSVGISIDGFPYGNAVYGGSRPDVCAAYPNRPGCPNVGWSFPIDTTALANGPHTLQVTGNTSNGRHSTVTTPFDVANTPNLNTLLCIDRPNAQTPALSNTASFSGWASDSNSAIASVSISIDGALWGTATYGGNRPDVCLIYPNRPGCPNVGWGFSLDTTLLGNGAHKLQVTGTSVAGRRAVQTSSFTVSNAP